jgi:hypothetical protein
MRPLAGRRCGDQGQHRDWFRLAEQVIPRLDLAVPYRLEGAIGGSVRWRRLQLCAA